MRFGQDFELDLRAYQVRRSGRVLKLERIPMELLLFLVEQRGELVTREQIVARIWGPGVFLDTDNSINGAIRKIRQVLKDDPEQPRFIQTIPGKGYRFIAPVSDREGEKLASPEPQLPPSEHPIRKLARQRWLILAGIAIGLIAGLGWLHWFHSQARLRPSGGRLMLAVLPFENLTGDSGEEYFSDGLTEEMITQMGRLQPERMGVIARTTAMLYKNSRKGAPRICRELGLDYILEGSVRREADRVRITTQLIQCSDQTQVWADTSDRDLRDILSVQSDVARAIATQIQLTLTPQQQARLARGYPVDSQAFEAYLLGRYFWNRRTEEALKKAIEYFEQAIARDPGYALAYSGLSDSYNLLHFYGGLPPETIIPMARAAARKALELDDQLAEAHTSLAYVMHRFDWDWPAAEREYKRALELNPNYGTAHHWYAEYMIVRGRLPEALEQIRRAQQVDPLSLEINTDAGLPFYFARQYDRAIEQYRKVVEMDPTFAPAHFALRDACELEGMYPDAIREFRQAVALSGGSESWVEPVARAFARSGPQGYWKKRLDLALHGPKKLRGSPAQIANLYVALADTERALEWLENAYQARDDELVWLAVEPWHDSLRSDPRFQGLARRMGLYR